MTSASSSIETKKARFMPLFQFTLKQKWTTGLLITIIMFFTLPVPVMMMLSDRTRYDGTQLTEHTLSAMRDWSTGIRFALIPILSVLAVVLSCAMFGYLKSKVSVDFYHSLPVKRGKLYINQTVSGYLLLMIPFVLMLLVTFLVLAVYGCANGEIISNLFRTLFECIVYTLFFYSLGILVGMVSGLTSVQLVLTIVATFIIPITYLSSIFFADLFIENMWAEWYCNDVIIANLSPAFRFALNPDWLRAGEIIIYLILAAAMFIGAYMVYMHRKSERSGMSVVFNPLGEVIKYLLVFPLTLLGGLFFRSLMYSFAWMIFGMICGAVLTFMLTNTILHKTAKAMFRGWKGLCVYGGVITVCLIVFSSNLFGINSNVPKPESTAKIEIKFNGSTPIFEFTDPDVIEAVYKLYTKGDWYPTARYYDEYNDYETKQIMPYYNYYIAGNSIAMSVVFYPEVGIPTAKYTSVYNKSAFIEQLRTILDSDEFKAQYAAMYNNEKNSLRFNRSVSVMGFDGKGNVYNYDGYYYSNDTSESKLPHALEADMKNVGFDFFQQFSFGHINAYTNGEYLYLPIYKSMTNTADTIYKEGYTNTPLEKHLEMLTDCIESMTVLETSTNETKTYSDKREINSILSNLTSIKGYNSEAAFTLADMEYVVNYTLKVQEVYRYSYNETQSEDEYFYEQQYESNFLYGKVPAFIISDFSK